MNEMILEVSLVKHLLLLTDTVLHPVIYQLTQGFNQTTSSDIN
jgi:hypothetical protein